MQEMEDLKAKNRRLQEELRKIKHQAEKPYEQATIMVEKQPSSARDLSVSLSRTQLFNRVYFQVPVMIS